MKIDLIPHNLLPLIADFQHINACGQLRMDGNHIVSVREISPGVCNVPVEENMKAELGDGEGRLNK